MPKNLGSIAWILLLLLFTNPSVVEAQDEKIDPSVLKHLEWRNIGPAIMGGRATDVEGVPGDPRVVYVGAASGGVWKTVDGGIIWKPIFDKQPVASVGDLALEPGNPDVIYVGTGESNLRNSVSFGNGVYKSTDGGETWYHLGLEETRHISRIVINPQNPQIIYVGAVGHSYGPNKERGVFMSIDSGKSWEKVLYLDDKHGVSDLEIDPGNPNILYAALWHFRRKPWTFTSGSEKGGVFKSVDGGRTWKKLEKGLPKLMGRIGVKVAPSNPQVVYVIPESKEGTLYRSDDRGESFNLVSKDIRLISRGFYYADIRVDPKDENRVYALGIWLYLSIDGGKTFTQISRGLHSDYHCIWIDPQDPNRIWQATDGGAGVSYNRGKSWEYIDILPFAQFYQIYADNREPFYYVGGGLQDNSSWYGPSRNREPFGILNDDWRQLSGGDGFFVVVHPDNPELFLSESQGGRLMRTDMRTREQQFPGPYPLNPFGGSAGEQKYRFNWNAPIVASPHDPNTVYFGGNVVFKSQDFGKNWKVVSPDLTTDDPEKQKSAGGPVWEENTTSEYYCTIISLAESPVQPGVFWAGTDDGNIQLTTDSGANWKNLIDNIRGIKPNSPVSHIEPSRTGEGTCYVAFDRHMFDDFSPYVFKTTDFGKAWKNISGNLPDKAYVWVVREDPRNPNVIYAGTELGLYVSYDSGKKWIRLSLKNLPTVAVHDILVHPRDNDLILGTHGRGIWIFDDANPIQELNSKLLAQSAHLFDVRDAVRFAVNPSRYGIGDKEYRGTNPPYGALITFYLKQKPEKDKAVKLEVIDAGGNVIRELSDIPREAGLNRCAWDLRMDGPRSRREAERTEEGEFPVRRPRGPRILPGTYRIRLTVDSGSYEKPVKVVVDPVVEVTAQELEQQSALVLKIRDMQSFVNDSLRELDQLLEQLKERKKIVSTRQKENNEEILKIINKHLDQIQSLQKNLIRPKLKIWPPIDEPPRLYEKLSDLSRIVDGCNSAPTPAQIEILDELEGEFNKALSRVNDYFIKSITEVNSALQQHNIPIILVPDPDRRKAWQKMSTRS